jgi:hypothetical protein
VPTDAVSVATDTFAVRFGLAHMTAPFAPSPAFLAATW